MAPRPIIVKIFVGLSKRALDVEAALDMINVEEITAKAIWSYFDLPTRGIK